MNRALFNRRLRQLHLWLGVAIGAQVGIWLISGLFMTWFPIEEVRGEHLVSERPVESLDWSADFISPSDAVRLSGLNAESVLAKRLAGTPVWQVEEAGTVALIDARSGEKLSPLSHALALQLVQEAYSGQGTLKEAVLVNDPPLEYGRPGPVWRIDYVGPDAATLYVDASSAEVKAVRTGLWRTFDFMWGLHIMDWSSRENFNSWWIKMTASLAVLFFFAGLGLVLFRLVSLISSFKRSD